MNHSILSFIRHTFLIAFLVCGVAVRAADDNIVALDYQVNYKLQAREGKLSKVEFTEKTVYTANRADATVLAYSFYGNGVTIDRATAPGVRPIYRAWQSEDIFHDGSRVCVLMPEVKKGKKVTVEFKQTITRPEQFCFISLMTTDSVIDGLVTIQVPAVLADKIKLQPRNFTKDLRLVRQEKKNGDILYSVHLKNRSAFRRESDAPSPRLTEPYIRVTGFFANVSEVYSFLNSYIDESGNDDAAVMELAKTLSARASNDVRATIDSTLHWVRENIRYLAIEHEDYGIAPAPANKVLADRAGDCKGSASLIRALLCKNGIDGRLVWIGTRDEIDRPWDSVPALSQGNHMIAAAVLPDTILYLDGTARFLNPRELPAGIRGQQAMIENGGAPMLRYVPALDPKRILSEVSADYTVDGEDLVGTIEHKARGGMRASLISWMQSPTERQERAIALLAYPKKNAQVSDISFNAPHPAETAVLSASLRDRGAAKRVADNIYLDLRPLRADAPGAIDLTDRHRPYDNGFPGVNTYKYTVKIPEGFEPRELPADFAYSDDWYDVSITYRVEDNVLICEASFATVGEIVPVERLGERNAAAAKLRRASEQRLVLQPKK